MSGITPDWAAILKKAGDAIREKHKTEERGNAPVVAPAVAAAAPKKSKAKKAKAKVVEVELPVEKEAPAEVEKKEKKRKEKKKESEEFVPKEKKDKKGKGKAKEVAPPVVEEESTADAEKLARRTERKAEKKRVKAEAKAKKLAKGSAMDTSDEASPPPATASKKKRKRVEEDEPAPIASTSKLPPPSPAVVDSPKPKKRKRDKKAASSSPSVPAPLPAPSTAPIDSPQKEKKRKHEPKEPSPVAIPSPSPASPAKLKSTRTRKTKAAKVVPTPIVPSIDVAAERQRILDRVVPNILRDLRAANPGAAPAPAPAPVAIEEEEIDELESEVERPIAPLPKRARRLAEEDPKFAKWAKRFPAAWKALVEQGLLVEVEEKSELGAEEEEERKRAAKRVKKEKKRKAKKEAASAVEEGAIEEPVVEEPAIEEVAVQEAAPAVVVEEKKRKAVESEDEAPSTSGSAIAEFSTPVLRAKPRRRPSQREKEIRAQGSQDESASPSLASGAPSLSPVLASPAPVASPALPIVAEASAPPVEEDVEMADAKVVGGEVSEPETLEEEVESVKEPSVELEEEQAVAELPAGQTLVDEEVNKDSEIEETNAEEKAKISASEAGDIEDDGEEEEDQLETTPSQLLPARQRLMSREQSIASSDDDPDEVALSLSQHVSKHATPYRPSPLVNSSQVGSDSGDEPPQREEDDSEGEQQQQKSSPTGSRQSTPTRQDVPSHSQPQPSPLKNALTPALSPDLVGPIPASQFPTPAQPRLQTIGGADSDSDSSSSDDSDSDDTDSDEEDRPVVAKRSRPSIGALAAEAFGKAPKSRASLFASPAKVVSQAVEVDEDFDQLLSQSLPQGVPLSAFILAEDKEEADGASSHSSRFSSVATESRETTPAREMRKLAAREVTPEDDASDGDVPAAAPERIEAHLVPLPPSSPTPELDAPLSNGDAMDVDPLPVASTSNGIPHPAPSSPVLEAAGPAPMSSPAKLAPSSPLTSQQAAVNGLSAIADYPASDAGPMGTFDLGSTQGDSSGDEEVPLPEESQFVPLVKEKELFFPETPMESLSQPTPKAVSFAASPRKVVSSPGPAAPSRSASPPAKSAPQQVEASPVLDTAALLPELEAAVAKAPSLNVHAVPLPPVVPVIAALPPTPSRVTRSSSAQSTSRSPSPAPSKTNGVEVDIESKLAAANQRALDAREHGPSVARRQPARLAATPSKPSAASRQTPSQTRSTRLSSAPLSSQLPPASPGPSRGGRASSMRGLSALPDLPSPGEGSPRRSARNESTNGRSQLSQASQPMTWTGKGDDDEEDESEEEEGEIRQKKVGIWG